MNGSDPAPAPAPAPAVKAKRGHGRQMLGSLAAALLIVAGAIWAVTARLGPTSIAELDAQEELADAQEERQEEAAEDAEEAAEERVDDRSGRRARGRD